jgi:5-methyltetrahydropteroyltriglutamate--homocysteine methyltransferase
MDDCDYQKADPEAYMRLAQPLDASLFNQVSLEDAHCNNDLAKLLPLFTSTTIVLGVIQICSSEVETVAKIRERATEALRWIPTSRLVLAPDCGLGYCTPELAKRKLNVLGEAARAVELPIIM